MIKKILSTLFSIAIFCSSTNLIAQNSNSCKTSQAIPIDDLLKSSDIFIETNLQTINAPERKAKKALLENYNFLKNAFAKKYVIKNTVVEEELNAIVDNIIEANPRLDGQKFNVFYATEYVANASSLGNNIFYIYPGLFEILDNDQQLTFILCHEIAHQLLNHFQYSLEESIRLEKNDLDHKSVLNLYRNKRELELNADALGFELYSNLNYQETEAIKALQALKNSDSILYSKNINIKEQFNFKEYPFKNFWINKKEQLLKIKKFKSNYRNLDSLRTHPNIDTRISAIKKIEVTTLQENIISKQHLNKIKQWQETNYLCALTDTHRYDLHLFFALEKHYKDPENTFASEIIASSLFNIYKAKKDKQFSKFIPPPNAFSINTSFTELKLFLKNTEAREIRKIGLWFCNSITTKTDALIKIQNKFKRLDK